MKVSDRRKNMKHSEEVKKEDYLSKSSDAYQILISQVSLIDDLALAYRTLGNITLGDKLFGIAAEVETNAKAMRDSVTMALNEQYASVQGTSAIMLESVMSGIEVGRKSKQEESNE